MGENIFLSVVCTGAVHNLSAGKIFAMSTKENEDASGGK